MSINVSHGFSLRTRCLAALMPTSTVYATISPAHGIDTLKEDRRAQLAAQERAGKISIEVVFGEIFITGPGRANAPHQEPSSPSDKAAGESELSRQGIRRERGSEAVQRGEAGKGKSGASRIHREGT